MGPWCILVCPLGPYKIRGGVYSMPTPVRKNDLKIENFPVAFPGRAPLRVPDPTFGGPLGPCSARVHRASGALAVQYKPTADTQIMMFNSKTPPPVNRATPGFWPKSYENDQKRTKNEYKQPNTAGLDTNRSKVVKNGPNTNINNPAPPKWVPFVQYVYS